MYKTLNSEVMSREVSAETAIFSLLSQEEIINSSVCYIDTPLTKKNRRNQENTVYDPRMGVLENGRICPTCGLNNMQCPGHYGYIILPFPVMNRLYIPFILEMLTCFCTFCSRLRIKESTIVLQRIDSFKGRQRRKKVIDRCKKVAVCLHCNEVSATFYKKDDDIYKHYDDKKKNIRVEPNEIRNIFEKITNDDLKLMGFNHDLPLHGKTSKNDNLGKENIFQFRPEDMIFTVLPVVPPYARPFVIDGGIVDDRITLSYDIIVNNIIKYNKETEEKKPKHRKIIEDNINLIIDNHNDKTKNTNVNAPTFKCFFQRIQGVPGNKKSSSDNNKKDGRVRENINGKRTSYSARSVIIGGGMEVRGGEVGIPELIANELPCKEKILEHNIDSLQLLVDNCKIKRVFREKKVLRPSVLDDPSSFKLVVGDVVERPLRDGDYVVFNRQPSLQPQNIIVFKSKILSGNVDKPGPIDPNTCLSFRLQLPYTKGFNADFDGDEMNLHVAQSIPATCEMINLMYVEQHIITAQKNAPIAGPVQDILNGLYLITNTWLKEPYETMVTTDTLQRALNAIDFNTDSYKKKLKTIKKYYPNYFNKKGLKKKIPGKIVYSFIFPDDLFFQKITETNSVRPKVIIREGIILEDSGPLCSKVIGIKSCSIIHKLWIEYSSEECLNFISNLQIYTYVLLSEHGFSMGISDCISTGQDKIASIILKTRIDVENISNRKDISEIKKELMITGVLNSAMNEGSSLSKSGMYKDDRNSLNVMMRSGAKGSVTNLTQITAFLGQQIVSGKRVALSLTDRSRSLYHFLPGDDSPEARGFITSSYSNGLSPMGAFFHAMSGREGVTSTSVGTATTGYTQRRECKSTENMIVQMDGSVRDINTSNLESSGRIIQYVYGCDGMNPKYIYKNNVLGQLFFVTIESIAEKLNHKYRLKKIKLPENAIECLLTEFIIYDGLATPVAKLVTRNVHVYLRRLLSRIEIREDAIQDLVTIIRDMYEKAKVPAGYPAGSMASCSLGEPTTQMTLNIFHLAGVENVSSQGIPRVIELLNVTNNSKIVTGKIFFKTKYLEKLSRKISSNPNKLDVYKKRGIEHILSLRSTIVGLNVSEFIESTNIMYHSSHTIPEIFVRHANFEKYKYPYFAKVHFKLFGKLPFKSEYWILRLNLKKDVLYTRSMTTLDISKLINDVYPEMYSVPSFNCESTIDVYVDYTSISNTLSRKEKLLIGEFDVWYDICSKVVLNRIKAIHINGITGITDMVAKYYPKTNSWGVEVQCSPGFNTNQSTNRLIEILNYPGIDQTLTFVDDVHAIFSLYGKEAARQFMFEEFMRILANNNGIDPRHIGLLVDVIFWNSTPMKVNSKDNRKVSGPISRLLYEQPVNNAVLSSIAGDYETSSVDFSVMFGTPAKLGTGVVKI